MHCWGPVDVKYVPCINIQLGKKNPLEAGYMTISLKFPTLFSLYGRLEGGDDDHQGRVEIKQNPSDTTWHVICDKQWSKHDANVVCRQLGYRYD